MQEVKLLLSRNEGARRRAINSKQDGRRFRGDGRAGNKEDGIGQSARDFVNGQMVAFYAVWQIRPTVQCEILA
jgi:hypothetical protein